MPDRGGMTRAAIRRESPGYVVGIGRRDELTLVTRVAIRRSGFERFGLVARSARNALMRAGQRERRPAAVVERRIPGKCRCRVTLHAIR